VTEREREGEREREREREIYKKYRRSIGINVRGR